MGREEEAVLSSMSKKSAYATDVPDPSHTSGECIMGGKGRGGASKIGKRASHPNFHTIT
jgi:hypothetical protein